jgi:malate synthase
VWQWIRHGAAMEDGRKVTVDLADAILKEEMTKIRSVVGDARYAAGQYERASKIFSELITSREFVQFLTLPAYEYLA